MCRLLYAFAVLLGLLSPNTAALAEQSERTVSVLAIDGIEWAATARVLTTIKIEGALARGHTGVFTLRSCCCVRQSPRSAAQVAASAV